MFNKTNASKGGDFILTIETLKKIEDGHKVVTGNDLIIKAQLPVLTVQEQRLVLYMLAMVEQHDEDFKTYVISIKELKKVLEVTSQNIYKEFEKATDGLMTKLIKWIEAPYTEDEELKKVAWCSFAGVRRGLVKLRFDPALKPFLLDLKNNFTQMELRAVIRLKNHYSLRLYQFIKYWQGHYKSNSAAVQIDWLKQYLGILPTEYTRFNDFIKKLIIPAQKNIAEVTDIQFTFEAKKEPGNRKHTQIEFTWEKNPRYNQLSLFTPEMERQFLRQESEAEGGISLDQPPIEFDNPLANDLIAATQIGPEKALRLISLHGEEIIETALEDLQIITAVKKERGEDIPNPAGYFQSLLPKKGEKYQPSNYYLLRKKQEQEEKRRKEKEEKDRQEAEKVRREEWLKRQYEAYIDSGIATFKATLSDEELSDAEQLAKEEVDKMDGIENLRRFGVEKTFIKSKLNQIIREKAGLPSFEEWQKQVAQNNKTKKAMKNPN
jgi:plasmid replication initiation protein